MRRIALVLLAVVTASEAATSSQVHYVMGTYLRITAEGARAPEAMQGCFQDARRLEGVFSLYDETSELSRLNAGAGTRTPVSADLARLLRRAIALSRSTGGTFDVTVGPLVRFWQAGGGDAGLDAVRSQVGATHVTLEGVRVALDPGTRLDFDGIAKGYAVDRCVARLRATGVHRALVSLGESSVYAIGTPSGATAWELPLRGSAGDTVGVLRLRDVGVSVSAAFGGPGRKGAARVAHIIDPRSGRPVTADAVAIVLAPSATDAEAYSKALVIWGASGVDRVERLGGAAALHVAGAAVRRGRRAVQERVFIEERRPLDPNEEALW